MKMSRVTASMDEVSHNPVFNDLAIGSRGLPEILILHGIGHPIR